MGVIANDGINDSIYIGNDNNDYVSQALVIGLQSLTKIEINFTGLQRCVHYRHILIIKNIGV